MISYSVIVVVVVEVVEVLVVAAAAAVDGPPASLSKLESAARQRMTHSTREQHRMTVSRSPIRLAFCL